MLDNAVSKNGHWPSILKHAGYRKFPLAGNFWTIEMVADHQFLNTDGPETVADHQFLNTAGPETVTWHQYLNTYWSRNGR